MNNLAIATEELDRRISRLRELIALLEDMVPTASICQELNKARVQLYTTIIEKKMLLEPELGRTPTGRRGLRLVHPSLDVTAEQSRDVEIS